MNVDISITRVLNQSALAHPLLKKSVYFLGVWLAPLLVLIGVLVVWLSVPEEALAVGIVSALVALFARFGITGTIYRVYKRPRPSEREGITPLFLNTNPSFPSGHATFFSALAMCLFLLNIPGALIYGVLVLCMCIARIALGVHYPSDILGGLLIGMGTAFVCLDVIRIYW